MIWRAVYKTGEMRYKVFKYASVNDEIEEVIKYYESVSDSLGKRVEDEILKALYELENNPNHYFNLADNIHRRILVNGFPYMLVYTIESDTVLVKILFPQRDDPAKLLQKLTR